MTDETQGVPTTDAEFDDALASSFDGDEETVEEPIEQEEVEAEEVDVPEDDIEYTLEDESPEDAEAEVDLHASIADVAKLIKDGDTEAATKRLSEYGKGLQKLETQRNESLQYVDQTRSLLQGVAKGDPESLSSLAQIIASHGGDVANIAAWYTGEEQPAPPTRNTEVDELRREIAALKQGQEAISQGQQAKDWSAKHGAAISETIKKITGGDISPEILFKVRAELPRTINKSSIEQIENAVMKLDPSAYRKFLSSRSTATTPPESATIPKGGKGGSKVSPNLLDDPVAFERYIG